MAVDSSWLAFARHIAAGLAIALALIAAIGLGLRRRAPLAVSPRFHRNRIC